MKSNGVHEDKKSDDVVENEISKMTTNLKNNSHRTPHPTISSSFVGNGKQNRQKVCIYI